MDLLDLFVKIGVQDEASDKVESIGSKLKTGLATAGKVGAAGIGLVTTAASAAVGGLLALESASEEYRVAQGKLNAAFQAAGLSSESAREAYTGFYEILGDTDTATEASQLLAKLVQNESDIVDWTYIAAGVYGTFGDSLPIEGLIEASNETAKVGEVTGVLADALNWAGISEDDFNAALSECTSEAERNQLITETLYKTYEDATSAFYQNNQALYKARDAQILLDETMATLGETVSQVKTNLLREFMPSLAQVASGFTGMVTGVSGAEQQFSQGIGNLITSAVAMLPQFLDFGVQILSSVASGIVDNLPVLISAVPQVITSLVTAVQDLWPTIVDAGGQILVQVGNGIVEAIPDMLEKLPDVIVSLLEFFTDNFPKIITTGAEMLGQLLGGIIGAIPTIALKLPEVIVAIVQALETGWDSLKEAGKYLLEGLWAGISDKVQWLKDKVSGVVDTIKGWFTGSDGFDEHSPSRWSRQVFRYIMDGGALGLDDGLGNVMNTIESAGNTIKNGLSFGTASVDFASSGLGVSSAGIINSFGQSDMGWANGLTVNLTLPDGTKFATWQLPYLIKVGSAAGTPIAETQRA